VRRIIFKNIPIFRETMFALEFDKSGGRFNVKAALFGFGHFFYKFTKIDYDKKTVITWTTTS